jgi:hypothetical protein
MALTMGSPLSFGLRNVIIIPITEGTDELSSTIGDQVNFGFARSFQYTVNMTEVNQEGNDRVLATEYFDEKGTGQLEAAGMNIIGLGALWGQDPVIDGVSPNQTTSLIRDVTIDKPFVALQGRSKSSSGGAMTTTIMKAKAGGGPNMTQQYGQFGNAQIPFSFVPNASGQLISLDEYETFADSDSGGQIIPPAPPGP